MNYEVHPNEPHNHTPKMSPPPPPPPPESLPGEKPEQSNRDDLPLRDKLKKEIEEKQGLERKKEPS
jgi:hypothetical protein